MAFGVESHDLQLRLSRRWGGEWGTEGVAGPSCCLLGARSLLILPASVGLPAGHVDAHSVLVASHGPADAETRKPLRA